MYILLYSEPTIKFLDKNILISWLKVLYKEVYGCDENDTRIYEMTNKLETTVILI